MYVPRTRSNFKLTKLTSICALPGLITRFSVLTHALYDESVSRSIVYLASVL